MIKKILLRLKDPRLAAALAAVRSAGRALGDLAEKPALAQAFFTPLRLELSAARRRRGAAASLAALAAAEELAARLERLFGDLARHGSEPDAAMKHALACLEAACAELGRGPSLQSLCAAGRASLKAAAGPAAAGFPQKLKYSSMYSDLDAAFAALERCAGAARGA